MSLLTDDEIDAAWARSPQNNLRDYAKEIEAAVIRKLATVSVEPPYLCKSTRFKMSFFQNEDGQGGYTDGTHVTCFEAFEDELDGKWVALVPAEDDRHVSDFQAALAAARVQENERIAKHLAEKLATTDGLMGDETYRMAVQHSLDAIRMLIGGGR